MNFDVLVTVYSLDWKSFYVNSICMGNCTISENLRKSWLETVVFWSNINCKQIGVDTFNKDNEFKYQNFIIRSVRDFFWCCDNPVNLLVASCYFFTYILLLDSQKIWHCLKVLSLRIACIYKFSFWVEYPIYIPGGVEIVLNIEFWHGKPLSC